MFKNLFQHIKQNPSKYLFWGIVLAILPISIRMSLDAGMSGDEHHQIDQAKNVYNYYTTLGKDTTAAHFREEWNLAHYAQSVDNLAYAIAKIFNIEDQILVRHVTNSFCGWLIVLLGGIIAFQISGKWRAAIIVVLLMFFSPRLLGHSFNNLKDTSFATAMFFGIYTFIRFFKEFPKPSWKTLILMTLSIGFAIGVRIGGLLLIPYLGLFGFVYFIKENSFKGFTHKNGLLSFWKLVKWGVVVSIIGFILGILVWPYGLTSPIKHTIHTFQGQSAFSTGIRQLFEGSMQWSDMLPWYYTPKLIFMTIPIAVIIGLLCFFTFLWKDKKNYFYYFIIFFAFFFPVFWIVYTGANVYGGWRHSLFAYPPMVVAAGLGFNLAIEWVTMNKTTKIILINITSIAVILLLLWNPIRHIIKNHPYEYVYFNELAGGIDRAYGNYEMDYYYHSTREASEWVIANAEKSGMEVGEKIRVVSWHLASVKYFFRNDTANFQVSFSRWYERGNNNWDYAIFTITGMMPEEIKNASFPPKNTVYQVTVADKPICLVLKRETKDDLIGSQLKNNKEYVSAIYHLKGVADTDPANSSAFINLIESYFNSGKIDSAKIYIDQLLEYVPKYEPANYMLAHYYNTKREPDMALKVLKTIREHNIKFKAAYNFAFQIYAQQNDLKNAEKMMIELMMIDQLDEQGMNQLLAVYKAQGLDERGAYKKAYKKYADTYEKLGKKEDAKKFRNAAKKM